MQPTYYFFELKYFIRTLEPIFLDILINLVEEEKDRYLECELRAFYKLINIRNSLPESNLLKVDLLLSYN